MKKKEKPTLLSGQGANLLIRLFQKRPTGKGACQGCNSTNEVGLPARTHQHPFPWSFGRIPRRLTVWAHSCQTHPEKGRWAPRWQRPRALALDHPGTAGSILDQLAFCLSVLWVPQAVIDLIMVKSGQDFDQAHTVSFLKIQRSLHHLQFWSCEADAEVFPCIQLWCWLCVFLMVKD